MPTYEESTKVYIAMYVGFSDGLSYFQPCYIRSNIWEKPFIGNYNKENCPLVDDPVRGYDARCRPWYQEASLEKNKDYALVNEPYKAGDSDYVFVTVSQHVELEDGMEAVVAIDINMSQGYFERMIAKNLAAEDQGAKTYESYFLATKG